jgi:putative MATE family efflux protein
MKNNKKYEIDMTNGTIMDKLITFSLPLMLSGILQLMFNAVDIIVVGQFSGSRPLAAVGSTSALINVFTNFFIGISLGTNVLAALYLKIYFVGVPFFMLYNYGAAVLRAVGDTRRPLVFLVISGTVNAILNVILVVAFHLDVEGVAIATVISQMISCVLVLRCLCKTDAGYQLHFSKLSINGKYLRQIFQVGVPAGIQSTVINFSNVLLQSSVNSFGSIAMAGYTAANNLLGFLYTSINAVTQACMSFTSQNYGVKKTKRMDRVLVDCIILSILIATVMGGAFYVFGPQILSVYNKEPDVIKSGMEILSFTTLTYFLCGIMDLFPGAMRGMGRSGVPMILSIIGTVGTRIFWIYVVFPRNRALDVLFISYPVSWGLTIAMQVCCFILVRRKVHREIQ